MITDTPVADLAAAARAVIRADSPATVFKALLEASRIAVPRASVFLARRGELNGWGSVGYPTEAAQAQRTCRTPLDRGWLGSVALDDGGASSSRPSESCEPDFGQQAAADAVGFAIRIDGKPIALVIGERAPDESPWLPEALALLTDVARLRLELNLARRRAASAETAAAPAPDGRKPTADEPSASEPAPDLEVARRYARLVATDIRLYNEEAVMLGRRNGDLVDRIGEHLDRGKETFVRRHGDLGPTGIELLHEAYVQVLAAGDAALIPSSMLE